MTSDREFRSFVLQLNADVRDKALGGDGQGAGNFKEIAFTELVLDFLEESGISEGCQVAFYEGRDGRGLAKVNGYALDAENQSLDIFTTVFVDAYEPRTVTKEEITKAAERATRFCQAALGGIHKGMEAASDAFGMARHIHSEVNDLQRIRIFVLSDGTSSVKHLDPTDIDGLPTRFEVWDAERLFRAMQVGLPRDEITIDFEKDYGGSLPCLEMPEKAADYMAYLTIIPGDVLFRLYDEYGPRLLEYNVRSFLSARGKVNAGIRKTLRNEPDRFMAYNNGIVVTVDDIVTIKLPDGRTAIKAVHGLQIVNGGQTTASIQRAKKSDKSDISTVYVPAKVTLIDPEKEDEIVRQVSRYANTQNVIQMADFSANEPFHIEIERLSERVWCPGEQGRWFYERARGQYQVAKAKTALSLIRKRRFNEQTPASKKFTKTDLAKFENSWAQKPHVVSFGAQKNFDHFMQGLRGRYAQTWLPDDAYYRDLVAKAILFKAIQRIVRQEQLPAYRANIVTYVMACLAWKASGQFNLERVWEGQEISESLREMLRSWSHAVYEAIIESAGGKNVTEWCKKEACWQRIKDVDLAFPVALPPELANRPSSARGSATTVDDSVTPEDYENIARCKRVDGATWLKLVEWGTSTENLEKWQRGIAHTLSGYAAAGWARDPSPKQAKHGVKILAIAEESGLNIGSVETSESLN